MKGRISGMKCAGTFSKKIAIALTVLMAASSFGAVSAYADDTSPFATMSQEEIEAMISSRVSDALANATSSGTKIPSVGTTLDSATQQAINDMLEKYGDIVDLSIGESPFGGDALQIVFKSGISQSQEEQEAVAEEIKRYIYDNTDISGSTIKYATPPVDTSKDTEEDTRLKAYCKQKLQELINQFPMLSSFAGDITDNDMDYAADQMYNQLTENRTKTITEADIDAYIDDAVTQMQAMMGFDPSTLTESLSDALTEGSDSNSDELRAYFEKAAGEFFDTMIDDLSAQQGLSDEATDLTADLSRTQMLDYIKNNMDAMYQEFLADTKYSNDAAGVDAYFADHKAVLDARTDIENTDAYKELKSYVLDTMKKYPKWVEWYHPEKSGTDDEIAKAIALDYLVVYDYAPTDSDMEAIKTQIDSEVSQWGAPDEEQQSDTAESEKTEGDVLVIRCWNEEFKNIFEHTMPGYEDGKLDGVAVEWILEPSDDGVYMNKLDSALTNNATAEEWDKVDLFLVDPDNAVKYANSDVSLPLSDLGVTLSSEQFDCANDMLKDSEGNQKGVMYAFDPGVLIYRRSIAKDVLGTDDPQEVQKRLSDWTDFEAVADAAKKKGYRMLASQEDLYRPMIAGKNTEWVVNGELQIPALALDWINASINFTHEGYTETSGFWGDAKNVQMFADGKTMCFFGPQWYYNFCMGNAQDPDIGCPGDWAICEGPTSYIYGGTGLVAATGTDNPTLVAKIMQTYISDVDTIMEAEDEHYSPLFFNNRTAMKKLASDANYNNEFLGYQNDYRVLLSAADRVKWNNVTIYDTFINDTLVKYIMRSITDTNMSTLDACNKFLDEFITAFPAVDATAARALFKANFGTSSQSDVTTTGATWVEVEDVDVMIEAQRDSSGKTTEPAVTTVQPQQTKWEDAPKTVETPFSGVFWFLGILGLIGTGTFGVIYTIKKRH